MDVENARVHPYFSRLSVVAHHHQVPASDRGDVRAWPVKWAGGIDEHEDPGTDEKGVRIPFPGASGGVVDAGVGWVLPAATGA